MVRNSGFSSRMQVPVGGTTPQVTGVELPHGSFQSINQSRRAEAQCRLPPPRPPPPPPAPPVRPVEVPDDGMLIQPLVDDDEDL